MRAETIGRPGELRKVKVDYIAGASASLNKTATVIMKILEDEGKRPTRRLRAFLYEKLGDFAVTWYRKGFSRGHKESDKQWEKGRVCRFCTLCRPKLDSEMFTITARRFLHSN
jgi:hypothetical protein